MDEFALTVLTLYLFNVFQQAESRHCRYTTSEGTLQHIICASYEFCCGRSCCRSPALTFYQMWYFWLSVILILLLCSGGGWWYRFKYRGHVYTRPSIMGSGVNAFYCPEADRVMLQNLYKDFRYPQHSSSPFNSQPSQQYACNPTSAAGVSPLPPQVGLGVGMDVPRPPLYTDPPPSYDSIFKQGKNSAEI